MKTGDGGVVGVGAGALGVDDQVVLGSYRGLGNCNK